MIAEDFLKYSSVYPANHQALEDFITEYLQSSRHQQITKWIDDHAKDLEYKGITVTAQGTVIQRWKGGMFGSKMATAAVYRANKEEPVSVEHVISSFIEILRRGASAKQIEKLISPTHGGNWQFAGYNNSFVFFVSACLHESKLGLKLIDIRDEINNNPKPKQRFIEHEKKKSMRAFRPLIQNLLHFGVSPDEIHEIVNESIVESVQRS